MQFMDLSELFKLGKVRPEIVKSGEFKDLGNPSRKMRKKERELLEASVLKVHEQFREDIILRRGKKIKGKLIELTQGQIFSGQEALEQGLVDGLGGLYTVSKIIHEKLKLKGDFREIVFIKKPKKSKLMNILDQLEEPEAMIKKALMSLETPMIMFK